MKKFLSTYIKEMKIAGRGFYFYIEIVIAIIALLILLLAVQEEAVSKSKEFVFYDADSKIVDYVMTPYFENGSFVKAEDTVFNVKPMKFEVVDDQTGKTANYSFDKGTVTASTIKNFDIKTGKLDKTIYLMNSYEDMLRMSYSEQNTGAVVSYKIDNENNITDYYEYYLQGYETEKLKNVLYLLHENTDTLQGQFDQQKVKILGVVEKLNNREAIVPIFLAFAGSLMGIFIVMAYVFLDKDEGVIKAFAVTPASMGNYLLSKICVILTTVLISSVIITIPVMGTKPSYWQLLVFLMTSTFLMTTLGLFISSFFDNITKSFGFLFAVIIVLMLPMFSYFIPGFDPVWLRYFPTYSMLMGYKEILLGGKDVLYILMYSAIYLLSGVLLFEWAKSRFRKTLTV